jgi:hypothetical protein
VFSHVVTHACVVQFCVLTQSMMSPHAALFVHAAPCAQQLAVRQLSHAGTPVVKLPHIVPPLDPLLLPLEPLEPLEPLVPLEPLLPPLVRHFNSACPSGSQPPSTVGLPELLHLNDVAFAAHAWRSSASLLQLAGIFAWSASQSDTHDDCFEHFALAAAAQIFSHVVPAAPLLPLEPLDPLEPLEPLEPLLPLLPGFGLFGLTLVVPPSPRSLRSIVRTGDEHAVTSPSPARETPQANRTKRMTNLRRATS